MGGTGQKRLGAAALSLLAVGFVAAAVLSDRLLAGLRLDLTENRLYTLSEGTRNVLAGLDEPINLYFFFSEEATRDLPTIRNHADRVREMLDEFEARADGALRVTELDPEPFSEAEDRAAAFGLSGAALGPRGETVYFGLAGTNSVGDQAAIPFFDPANEALLEYDLAKLVYTLEHPDLPVVGLISGLEMGGGFDPMAQRMREDWVTLEQARQLFEVRELEPGEPVGDDVDVLWVVHPKALDDAALYAIDQYVLGGGHALVFVDPFAEIDQPGGIEGMQMPGGRSSTLGPLFDAWGLRYDPNRFVADATYALQVGGGMGARPVRHLGIIGPRGEAFASDDVLTAQLGSVNLAYAGWFELADDASVTLEPLIETSELAMPMDAARAAFLPDPSALQQEFEPTGQRYVLAARISGSVATAFPDGRPETGADMEPDGEAQADAEAPAPHRARSDGSIDVIVVADADLLADRLWVQMQSFFGQRIPSPFANNGDLLINALDQLAGSEDLIDIRGRAVYSRPFERVEALRRDADQRLSRTLARLETELRETEARLAELQAARDDQSALILSPEQEAELERFRDERLRIRQELRQVRRDSERAIEELGAALRVINIGLVPLLLTLGALALVWLRRRRRRT
jgi:ABC-type uncharacterized transport system involved in gliding motility auxiliary subunit